MKAAGMIGDIWVTCREEKLAGLKPLLVQPLDVLTRKAERPPIVVADIIGTGVGEIVLVVGGSSAHSATGDMSILVDATVAGIVDDQETDRSVLP